MKILHVGKLYPNLGGMETMIWDIIENISQSGIRCDWLCAAADKPGEVILSETGRIICTPSFGKLAATMITPAMIVELRKICQEYDIIHVHHPDPMATLALFCSGYKGKIILHWHSDILKQKQLFKLYRPLQNWMINRADLVIGTSPIYLEKSPHLINAKDKLACLPIGVGMVVPDNKRVESIRQCYNGKKIIFTLGRLVGYKGHKYLIDAARYLSDDYVILIGGDGPLKPMLQEQIRKENLQQKVILLGKVPDMDLPHYYGACDVFCLSSIWKTEAFGMVQIEAMSCAKPVVATQIEDSGVPWVNKHRYSGLNVQPENGKAIADAIKEILSSTETYEKYSKQAFMRYKEHFTKEMMNKKCLEIYRLLLEDKAAHYGLN